MFRSLLALFKRRPARPFVSGIAVLDWAEVPENPKAPILWSVEKGSPMPPWAWNALIRKEIVPVPEPVEGQLDWGGDGIRVIETGRFVPLGGTLRRDELQPNPTVQAP